MSRSGLGWFAVGAGSLMVRWLFLTLLLVNGVYFGWHLRQANDPVEVARPSQVAQLRLLDEVDRSMLLPRQVVQSSASAASVVDDAMCRVITGIVSEAVAQRLQERLERLGLTALVSQVDVERVEGYELTLDQPADQAVQRTLEASLVSQGLSLEVAKRDHRNVYIVGRFKTRAALNQARGRLNERFELGEYEVIGPLSQFEVWIEADSSLETDNKIKEVDGFLNSAMKIEKKLCKRVASAGTRD